ADSDAPVVQIHLDFMCPHCGTFEEINAADISTMVENEEATVQVVPRRFMDSSSSSGDFSSRAANALTAVYADDPANTLAFQELVFANQPAQGSAGPSDDELWAFAEEVGASGQVRTDIEDRTYQPWVRQVSDPYGEENGGGTPYVEIDGEEVSSDIWGTEGGLREAVLAAGGGEASDGGEGCGSQVSSRGRSPAIGSTGWSGATVAHLSCKQAVAGSIPVSSSHVTSTNAHR